MYTWYCFQWWANPAIFKIRWFKCKSSMFKSTPFKDLKYKFRFTIVKMFKSNPNGFEKSRQIRI